MMLVFLLIICGLVIGSFLNVCISRIPKGESLIVPGSHCPNCLKGLPFYDNIPILSFIFLRGRCRFCGVPISWRYPVVEFLSVLILLYFYKSFSFTPRFGLGSLLFLLLFVIAVIDWEHEEIPDMLILLGGILGVIGILFKLTLPLREAVLGFFVGGAVLYLVAVLGKFLFKREAMGSGDIKLLAMLGLFFGWQGVVLSLAFASILGSLLGFLIIRLRKREDRVIPFAPFLAFGAFVVSYLTNI